MKELLLFFSISINPLASIIFSKIFPCILRMFDNLIKLSNIHIIHLNFCSRIFICIFLLLWINGIK